MYAHFCMIVVYACVVCTNNLASHKAEPKKKSVQNLENKTVCSKYYFSTLLCILDICSIVPFAKYTLFISVSQCVCMMEMTCY